MRRGYSEAFGNANGVADIQQYVSNAFNGLKDRKDQDPAAWKPLEDVAGDLTRFRAATAYMILRAGDYVSPTPIEISASIIGLVSDWETQDNDISPEQYAVCGEVALGYYALQGVTIDKTHYDALATGIDMVAGYHQR